jgi:hypothetical protein
MKLFLAKAIKKLQIAYLQLKLEAIEFLRKTGLIVAKFFIG